MDALEKNIQILKSRIEAACNECGRDKSKIQIVPATKTVPIEVINRLKEFSITHAAENKVQELLQKQPLTKNIDWHFIGTLQTNKVKHLIGKVSLIHSVDKVTLIDEIQKQAEKANINQSILIQINAGSEEQKSGACNETELLHLIDNTLKNKNLTLKGFMGVFPKNADESLYKLLSDIYHHHKSRISTINTLSMGMSHDLELSIKHNATLIRPGSLIFGQREYIGR